MITWKSRYFRIDPDHSWAATISGIRGTGTVIAIIAQRTLTTIKLEYCD